MFIVIFNDVVFSGMSFAKRDIIRFYYPVWKYVVDTMRQGHVPFWNPYLSFGTPLFANIQACVFYPPTLILYLPDFAWAFNFYILFHLALASFFTCVWMRDCQASKPASYVSGIAYGLGGFVLSTINLTISLTTLVYFPLALSTLKRALNQKKYSWKAISALVLLLQYLAGDPAVFFVTLIVYTFFVGFKTVQLSIESKKLVLGPAWALAQIMFTFLGLGAFHYVLFFEFISNSNRVGLSYDALTMWSVQYNDLLSVVVPYFSDVSLFFMDYWVRQSWLDNYYSGITVCVFAVVAMSGRNKIIINYHILMLILGVALALGRFCSIHYLLFKFFPFFSLIRYPVRFFFLFSFAAACLAGFGIDKILATSAGLAKPRQVSPGSTRLAVAIFTLVGALLVGITILNSSESKILLWVKGLFDKWTMGYCSPDSIMDMTLPVLENVKRSLILGLLTVASIFCACYLRVRKSILIVFFGLLVLGDLVDVNLIEMRIEKEYMTKPGYNVEKILEDKDLFRVMASPRTAKMQLMSRVEETLGQTQRVLMESLTPNFLLHYRIYDTVGYDSIHLKGPIGLNSMRDKVFSNHFFDVMNVKYVASPIEALGDNFDLANKTKYVNIFKNKNVLPRAFLVKKAEVISDPAQILVNLCEKPFDPEEVLYLEKDPGIEPVPFAQNSSVLSNKTEIVEYKPERIVMKVESLDKPWLFLSDAFYPGWKARVDGKEVKIIKANYAFRVIPIKPGKHQVEWVYEPTGFKQGLAVSLLTFLGLMVYFIRSWRLSKRVQPIG